MRDGSGGDTTGTARAARLKAALKANLGRRKAQARARGDAADRPAPGDDTDDTPVPGDKITPVPGDTPTQEERPKRPNRQA